ncbi:MAG: SDR family oxidoreductase [Deferribacterota bacterium]|nr:SDR family oxidoreductase [Deferribacterota bacterium]
MDNLFSLKGKNAVVIGGYRGIGSVFSETYAAAGANVIICARSVEKCNDLAAKLNNDYGTKNIGKFIDVKSSHSVDKTIYEIIDEYGKIDILVNSAGIAGSQKATFELTDEEIKNVFDVDFFGIFYVSRVVSRAMIEHKNGKIINVASIAAKIATRYMAGYCASKAAVVQLTRVMALELMKYNIQVNAVCPGYFLTDLNKDFLSSEKGRKLIKKTIPINRVGNLDELKTTALYLATCPPFLTGTEIYIDGGHTII